MRWLTCDTTFAYDIYIYSVGEFSKICTGVKKKGITDYREKERKEERERKEKKKRKKERKK